MSSGHKPTALITGASSGIGKASALALQAKGYRVFGASRHAATGEVTDGIVSIRMDVTNDASVIEGVHAVLSADDRIDLLVNNAGFGVVGAAEESSIEQAKAVFDTNLFGVMRTVRAVLPTMRRQRAGRIVNISSVLGFVPSPYMAVYVASKYALEGYSETVDHELRSFGIRMTLVEPAYVRTAFEANMHPSDQQLPDYSQARAHIDELIAAAMEAGDDPRIVADVVVRAATAAKPALRYPAGPTARKLSLLRRFAPAKVFDSALRKQMRLDA